MINILNIKKPEILILVETKLAGKASIKIEGYSQIVQRNRKEVGGGLLVAVKNQTGIEVIILNIEEKHEIMWLKVKIGNDIYILGIVYGYAAQSRSNEDEIEEWYYVLEKEISKHIEEKIVMVGDFNAHVGNDDLGIENNSPYINQNGQKLRSLVERRNLFFINSTTKCNGTWTREDPNGTKSIIDYVITNENALDNINNMIIDENHDLKFTRYMKTKKGCNEIPSDHNTITFELSGKRRKQAEKITIWNYKNGESLKRYREDTTTVKMKENWNDEGEINNKYKKWTNQIKSLMYKNLHRVTIKDKISNDVIKHEMNQKRKINKEIKRLEAKGIQGTIIEELRERAKELVTKIIEETDNEKTKKLKNRLNRFMGNNNNKENDLWSMRKKCLCKNDPKMAIKDKEGNIVTTKEQIFGEYEEHYKQVLTNRNIKEGFEIYEKEINKQVTMCHKITEYDEHEINEPFSEKEVREVIKSLKNNKSPGPDEFSNEIIINAGENLIKNMVKMFNYFWKHEKIPHELMKITIKSIYKGKGETNCLNNHRGIFLSSILLKFYEKLIMNRASSKIENNSFSEFQAGGRPYRGTRDQLFILRSVIEYKIYNKDKMILQFMDLTKAFDKMVLKIVMNNLWDADVRGKIWRVIYKINEYAELTIKTPFGLSNKFTCNEILKQGSVMASTLAAMHVDDVKSYFQTENFGVYYGEVRVENLLFQDDIVRFENSEEDMNNANIILEIFQNINKMEFHPLKTKVMMINGEKKDIKLGEHTLNYVDSMKYLGDIIQNTGKIDELIKERKNHIAGITAELVTIMAQINSPQEIHDTIRYVRGIIIPKLLANSETWNNISNKNIEDLETTQSKAIKRLLRIPYTTPSKGLLNELGLLSIENEIIKKKIIYLHHILTGKNQILLNVLMEQLKIPGNTWIENCFQEMKKIEITTDLDEIRSMSKYKIKKIVKKKMWEKQKKELINFMIESKKCSKLKINVGNPKKYISELSSHDAKTILMARLKMTNLKSNFKNLYTGKIKCTYCKEQDETLQHIIECPRYPKNFQEYENIINLKEIEEGINEDKEIDNLKIIAKIINEVESDLEEMRKRRESEEVVNERPGCEIVDPLSFPDPSSPNHILSLTGLNRDHSLNCDVIDDTEGCDTRPQPLQILYRRGNI